MTDEIQVPDSVDVGGDASEKNASASQTGQAEAQQVRLELDDSQVEAAYANLCFVSSTAEEIILDLALNKNPLSDQNRRVRISQRVILSPYTAKRLAGLLSAAVQRHEATFGVLETDVRKRIKPASEPTQ